MIILDAYNALCSLAIALCSGACIMSPRVRDGIVAKLGLVCISVAHLALAILYLDRPVSYLPMSAARGLVHTGLLLIVAAYWIRVHRAGNRQRRVADWVHPRRAP